MKHKLDEAIAIFVAAQHQFRIKLSFTGNSIKEFDSPLL